MYNKTKIKSILLCTCFVVAIQESAQNYCRSFDVWRNGKSKENTIFLKTVRLQMIYSVDKTVIALE